MPPAKIPADQPKDEKAAAKNEFIVFGTVHNEDGKKPMEGVEVWASAGMGTLRPTGKTTTDKGGKFRLMFTPGFRSIDGGAKGMAIVEVRKPGWYGWSYGWPASFILTDKPLTKEEKKEYPKSTNITPGVPSELAFRMEQAAALAVVLVDAARKPMPKAKLWLTGDRLPPGVNVIGAGETDANGNWTLTEVPRSRYRLVLGDPKDPRRELVLGSIEFTDVATYVAGVTVHEWTPTATQVTFTARRGKDLRP
jgi:hypothetical protein